MTDAQEFLLKWLCLCDERDAAERQAFQSNATPRALTSLRVQKSLSDFVDSDPDLCHAARGLYQRCVSPHCPNNDTPNSLAFSHAFPELRALVPSPPPSP